MKLNDVMRRMPGWYKARKSVYLKSSPGVGKTDTILQAPKILSKAFNQNIGAVVIQGPLLTPGDAIGYLMPKHLPDGRIESAYSDPYWFRTYENKRLEDFDGGIIFCDEMDKADTDVKKVLGECALSGRLGPHRLSGGWVLWGAGNRSEDRSGSTKELDHLINRRMEIGIEPDLQSLLDWMDDNDVSPLTKAFTSTFPEIVLSGKVPEKQGPWTTPRSLVGVDRYLAVLAASNGGEIPSDPCTVEEVSGMIGSGASQYFAHVKLQQEMPKYETIVADPQKARLPTKPDSQMLVAYNLAHRVSNADVAPVVEYITRLPKEFAVTFAKAACKRDNMLVATPTFQTWARSNSSLMAAIA
jgi:hypothetical protein